mmetsp:Transcript_117926/g.164266  ORF Transcript_117926/g.164266 Transcript_117926/m.164266 type:complete len:202 (-) Transcript_117926:20-625(-)
MFKFSVFLTIGISSLIGVNVILEHLFDILDGLSPHEVFITSFSLDVEFLGSVKSILKEGGILNILESDSELLDGSLLFTAVIAGPEPSLVSTVLHGSKITQGALRQQEVTNGLESLLLSHDKSNFLLSLVTEKFAVANTSLFPLVISESEELASHLEDAFLGLLTSLSLNFSEFNLSLGSFIFIDYVVFLLLNHNYFLLAV